MSSEIWYDYNPPRTVPNNALEYTLTNEQINLVASLVVGMNDVFSFQIPYPFYVDQREEAVIFHKLDFMQRSPVRTSPLSTDLARLQVDLQYSDKEPAANWDGNSEDVEDENTQAMFDGPFLIGWNNESAAPDADALLMTLFPDNSIKMCHYYPPDRDGLDAFFPVTVVLTNQSFSRDLLDQIADTADYAAFERFSMRCWFTTRKLTSKERDMMTSEYYGIVPFA